MTSQVDFGTITGMFCLFILRDFRAKSGRSIRVKGERSLHTKQTMLKMYSNGDIMMFFLLMVSWHIPLQETMYL